MKSFEYTVKDRTWNPCKTSRTSGKRGKEVPVRRYDHKWVKQNKKTDTAYDAYVFGRKAGDTVTVSAEGADEDTAIAELKAFFENNL